MSKFEFDGISTENFNANDIKENFTEYCDESLFIENKSFEVELDNKVVKLHLYIEKIDMSEYDDHIIVMGVIPEFKSLSKGHQEDILSQFSDEDKEYFKNNTDCLLYDIKSYGYDVVLHSVNLSDLDKVEYTINSAVAVRHAVSGLIGFELDKYVNRIGNTGWDLLNEYCDDIDSLKAVLNRYK